MALSSPGIGSGLDVNNIVTQSSTAQDAALTVDGVSVTSAANSVTGAIEGVTLSLVAAGSSGVSVAHDASAAKTPIQNLVKAYNDFRKTLSDATKFDANGGQSGPLLGDAAARTIQSQLRSALAEILPGLSGSSVPVLSQAGISFQRDGTLAIDDAKLSAALNQSTDTVSFTRGYAQKLGTVLDGLLSSSGLLAGRTDGIHHNIKDIDNQRDTLNKRLHSIETRYRAQFTALDTLLSSMQSTSNFLTEQLARLASASS